MIVLFCLLQVRTTPAPKAPLPPVVEIKEEKHPKIDFTGGDDNKNMYKMYAEKLSKTGKDRDMG